MSALSTIVGAALAAQSAPPDLGRAPALDVPGRTADVIGQGAMDVSINEKKSETALTYSWRGRVQSTSSDNVTARVDQSHFSARITVPLGGNDNLLAREAFDGLADGPSLTLSWTSFGTQSVDPWNRTLNPRLGPVADEAERQCLIRVNSTTPPAGFDATKCHDQANDLVNYDFLRTFSGLSIARLNRAVFSPVSGYGIEGSIGRTRFNYRTPVSLAQNTELRRQFSVKAYGILFPRDGVSMLTGSARYENGYEAQGNQILCRAVVANPNDDCVSAAPGPPRHVEKLQLEVEYRRTFEPIPGLGRFAIAPRIAIDAMSGEYEAELPIYLRLEGAGPLLPGLTISYDSRHDEVVLGLFLRRTFSF